jgi:hypothetical protein
VTMTERAFSTLGLAAVLALGACSGSSTNIPQTPPGTLPPCNPGTQAQLSIPRSGATGVGTQSGYVQVVVDATTDVLGGDWNLDLLDAQGIQNFSGILYPASGYGGTTPFPTNFYYDATTGTLTSGAIYKVFLNKVSSACQPALIGSFATSM